METSDLELFGIGGEVRNLCLRANGQNYSCKMGKVEPSKPYLALRSDGKNFYSPLVTPTNDSFPLRIKVGNNNLAPANGRSGFANPVYGTEKTAINQWFSNHDWDDMLLANYYYAVEAQNGATLTLGYRMDANTYYSDYRSDISTSGAGSEVLLIHCEQRGDDWSDYYGEWEVRQIVSTGSDENSNTTVTLDAAPDLDLTNYYVQLVPIMILDTFAFTNAVGNIHCDAWDEEEEYFSTDIELGMEDMWNLNWSTFEYLGDWRGYNDIFTLEIDGETKYLRKSYYNDESYYPVPYDFENHVGGLFALKVTGHFINLGGSFHGNESWYKIPCGDEFFIWKVHEF